MNGENKKKNITAYYKEEIKISGSAEAYIPTTNGNKNSKIVLTFVRSSMLVPLPCHMGFSTL